jgi:hypothetical protein
MTGQEARSAAQGHRWWQFWRRNERITPFTAPAPQTLSWPSAVMLCVRQPVVHHAILLPYEDYPAEYPNVFGPPRHGPRCSDCGALLYVAAARVTA